MKKVSFIVLERDSEVFLKKLRDLGVVHPEKKRASSESLAMATAKRDANRKAWSVLHRYPVKKGTAAPPMDVPDDMEMVNHVLALANEKAALQKQLSSFLKEKNRIQAWGDFDPHSFNELKSHGVNLFPYELTWRTYNSLGADTRLIVVSREKTKVRAFVVGEEIPKLDPFALPDQSVSEIDRNIQTIHTRIEEIETRLANLAYHKKDIEANGNHIADTIEFETVRAGMGSLADTPAAVVTWLSGFVPGEKIEVLKQAAEENGWVLAWDDPSVNDRPPTLLRNKPAVRIIQPLFSLLGITPGYWEHDISQSFLVFMCIFVGILFGDAAYGLIFLAVGITLAFISRKKTGAVSDVSKLISVFALCVIVWGSITGTWFAIPMQNLPPVLSLLIIHPFNSSGPLLEFPHFLQKIFVIPEELPHHEAKTTWNIQFLCFTIGMIQLVWAHGRRAVQKLPSLSALAQVGLLIMMVGIYFLVLSMLLKMQFPSFAGWLIGIGVAFNFIFAGQNGGNFLVNVRNNLPNLFSAFLKAISSFADVISYIRLFAVGFAGGIIANSFNLLALPSGGFGSFGINFILRMITAVLILICGHALNMTMNVLSVIVHGVRLNLLEYAGNHLEMGWSGYVYNPFANKQKV